jgi:ABC-type uncharacterized transport system substrate-binding protein
MHFHQWKRRQVLTLLGGAATAWPLAARAQPPALPVIGSLQGTAQGAEAMAGFHRGLSEMGYVEGRNLAIEYRWAEGRFDRLPAMATDLVSRRVVAIFAGPDVGVQAAMAATKTIPIVFATASDPVGSGFVASYARPGGNVTGFTVMEPELAGKWLELLREIAPRTKRVALLFNPTTAPYYEYYLKPFKGAVASFGLEGIAAPVRDRSELETVIATQAREPNSGLIAIPDSFLNVNRAEITSLIARYRVPAVYPFRFFAELGGLVSYGNDFLDNFRRAASYVDRILKGAKPSELPVQAPVKFDLVINLKTAKALNLDVPLMLQQRANEVIE